MSRAGEYFSDQQPGADEARRIHMKRNRLTADQLTEKARADMRCRVRQRLFEGTSQRPGKWNEAARASRDIDKALWPLRQLIARAVRDAGDFAGPALDVLLAEKPNWTEPGECWLEYGFGDAVDKLRRQFEAAESRRAPGVRSRPRAMTCSNRADSAMAAGDLRLHFVPPFARALNGPMQMIAKITIRRFYNLALITWISTSAES
jgi:hypothetical protein